VKKFVFAMIVLFISAAAARTATAQTFTVLHEFQGAPNDGSRPHAGLVQDAAGNLYGTTFTGGSSDEGSVFKFDTTGHNHVLFNFNLANGSNPESTLILDKAGNLYGTAIEGGGSGVLFRVNQNGEEEALHVFDAGQGADAALPSGGVIMDEAGNLYGATVFGNPGAGTLYRLDPAGNFTVLHEFKSASEGSNPQGPLVRDAAGNLYGSTLEGGAHNQGTIFRLSANGTLTVLHTFTGGIDGSGPQGGLLLDQSGNLIGSAIGGGVFGKGLIFAVTKSGAFRRIYAFRGGRDGANPNGALIQDPAGTIYGTTQSGPGRNVLGTAFELSRANGLTVLHNFTGGNDGAVPLDGLIRDNAGNLYGTTVKNFLINQQDGTIFRIKP
jgi:uncharacterized repeat protein (TIGR03803 family)